MRVEKIGSSYRVRKMVNGRRSCITFDHKPTQHEIGKALHDMYDAKIGTRSTFAQCLRDYININKGVFSPNTIKEKERLFFRLPQELLNKPICEFTEQYFQNFISTYTKEPTPHGKEKSPKTVSNMYNHIAVVLHKYGQMQFDIHLPQQKPDDSYFPSEEDIISVREYIRGDEFEVPFLIAISAGLREAEICALTLADVKNDMLHVTKSMYYTTTTGWGIKNSPKTDTSNRYVPIPHDLQEMIYEKGYIYKYVPSRLLKQLHKVQDKLGLPWFTFHALRSYYASAAHYIGVPDRYICKNTGHSNVSTLQKIYEKAIRDKQNEQDEKIISYFDMIV